MKCGFPHLEPERGRKCGDVRHLRYPFTHMHTTIEHGSEVLGLTSGAQLWNKDSTVSTLNYPPNIEKGKFLFYKDFNNAGFSSKNCNTLKFI